MIERLVTRPQDFFVESANTAYTWRSGDGKQFICIVIEPIVCHRSQATWGHSHFFFIVQVSGFRKEPQMSSSLYSLFNGLKRQSFRLIRDHYYCIEDKCTHIHVQARHVKLLWPLERETIIKLGIKCIGTTQTGGTFIHKHSLSLRFRFHPRSPSQYGFVGKKVLLL